MKILEATDDAISKAAVIIRGGGVVVYPTETVYGLGCDPSDSEAARRICSIKGRFSKPLPLACADLEEARRIVDFDQVAERVARRFWPGPLMLILPAKKRYSDWVTFGSHTLGVRVPSHNVARRLALLSGGVIVSTSANKSGKPPPRRAREAADDIGNHVDLILDGGPSNLIQPSTVLDLSEKRPKILRRGPISEEQLMNEL